MTNTPAGMTHCSIACPAPPPTGPAAADIVGPSAKNWDRPGPPQLHDGPQPASFSVLMSKFHFRFIAREERGVGLGERLLQHATPGAGVAETEELSADG